MFIRKLKEKSELSLRSVGSVLMEQTPLYKKTELASERRQTLNQWSVKKVFATIAVYTIIGSATNAQVKILTNGNVGIGTNSVCNDAVKLQINYGSNNIAIAPDYNGANIGTSIERLDFWHHIYKWNKIRIKGYSLSSDSTLKTEIIPLENATNMLKQIKTYSYYFKSDCEADRKKEYGVLAQEVEEILPDLIDTAKGTMLVNYNAFFAFLIKGFNEQQTLIETQQEKINQLQALPFQQQEAINQLQTEMRILQDVAFGQGFDIAQLHELRERMELLHHENMELREMILNCCQTADWTRKSNANSIVQDSNKYNNKDSKIIDEATLYQNTPNPFSSNTEISCYIPKINNNAFIYIYNLQGIELKSFDVKQGLNKVTISASELPAGMYLYTLVVDNEIIDTKRMILTK